MIRVVLDTNVSVSACIGGRGAFQSDAFQADAFQVFVSPLKEGRGSMRAIFEAWRDLRMMVLTSREQMEEIGEVLRRPQVRKYHGMSEKDIDEFLDELRLFSVLVEVQGMEKVVQDDPDDDFLLALGKAGGADYIVSGDQHLLALGDHHGIRIVSPGDFRRILEEAEATE